MNTKNTLFLAKRAFLTIGFLLLTTMGANAQTVFGFQNHSGDHLWSNAENWTDGQKPTGETAVVKVYADVIIDENVDIMQLEGETACDLTVQSGKKLTVRESISWSSDGSIVFEDKAQLVYNQSISATVMKRIPAYDAGTHLWNIIASPIVENIVPTIENGFLTEPETGYALFAYYEADHSMIDFKEEPFSIANGAGYLYANALDTTLLFSGNVRGCLTPAEVSLSYHSNNGQLSGCNFVGNPLPCNAYPSKSYYVLNEGSNSLIAVALSSGTPITPCSGIIVKAEGTGDVVAFSHEAPSFNERHGYLEITAAKSNAPTLVLDQALLSFNEGDNLGKFSLYKNAPMVYFTKNSKNLAILSVDSVDVQTLKFDAAENGNYTLHFELKDLHPEYLHLIDNMTGDNRDLLANPNYTFSATTTDYASRFKLVFDPHYGVGEYEDGPLTGSGTFAYYANGEIVINDVETQDFASLQIIDMTGRVIVRRDGAHTVSTTGIAPGVYVLRLSTTHGVRTQKMVIQ